MKPIILTIALSSLLMASGCCTATEKSARAAKLTIIKATYGVRNKTVDVTDAVASLVDGNSIRLHPIWVLGSVDPAFGTVKTVTIAYNFQGKIELATFAQNEEIVLPLKH